MRRKKPRRKTPWIPKVVKKFVKGNLVGLISILLTIIVSFTIYYLSYAEPELDVVDVMPGRNLDRQTDGAGNFVTYGSLFLRVKNFSFRPGYIDKIEFIPTMINTGTSVEATDIDRSSIGWREEKNIELKILTSQNLPKLAAIKAVNKRRVEFEIRIYDNTSNLVHRGGPHIYAVDLIPPSPSPTP